MSSLLEKESVVVAENKSPRYLGWMYRLDNFGIEVRGIERVLPEERQNASRLRLFVSVLGLWFAGCGGVTTMSSFFLPTLFYSLNMKMSLIAGLVGMNIGNLIPAYCSTMGPKSGCRQMVTARFLFGQWGVKFVALICIIGGIGWSVVNCVVGGQILLAISGTELSVGIVVITVASLVIGVLGIRVLLQFQTILAIPTNLAILLYYIVVCKRTGWISEANTMVNDLDLSTLTQTGHFLSFFTVAYSVTATWGSCASDYYILFPDNTPSSQVFWVTYLGIAIPSNFAAVVGTMAGTIAYSYTPWADAYNTYGIGGLLAAGFEPWGKFGKFVVVIMFISLICNTVMNTYSCAFEFQLIDTKLAIVPRWMWATVISVIYLVLSLAGKEHLSTILGNVLPMLGYWISMYIVLLLEENLLFRNSFTRLLHFNEFDEDSQYYMYNWNNWNKPKNITLGLASAAAFCCGVGGAVLGMNQVYYIGVLARKIGADGGDIGMWLCMGFTGVTYPILRYVELKSFGR